MYSEDIQELLVSYNQELTMDELIEMHEQGIEELVFIDPVQSQGRMAVGDLTESLNRNPLVSNSPKWSSKIVPTWLYRQDFTVSIESPL
ncbi:hypothetical protein TNCV_5095761 [Trichonephila clavipes]|nr:hypothetical protein TNCV_5095761 [Trichonephila clavipes]